MKLKIKTTELQALLDKVGKCASNNKMLPLTCMTCLESTGDRLYASTTSGSDYCYANVPIEESEGAFYVTVNNDVFYKLVSKSTCEYITLETKDAHLAVMGNGKYTVELPVDENGDLVKFPQKHLANLDVKGVIKKESLEIIHKTNKANLSNSLAEPCYTGYYIGEQVITSDRSVICVSDIYVFDTPILVNDRVMNTLDTDVEVAVNDEGGVAFYGDNYTVVTKSMDSLDEFNAEDSLALAHTALEYSCSVSKSELLTVLDRLSLFVSVFDKNCLSCKIAETHLTLANLKDNSQESISIKSNGSYKFNVDIEVFKKQVSVLPVDVFKLQFGSDMFIKLVTDDVIEIVPLLVE